MDLFKDCIKSLNDKEMNFLDENTDAEKHYNPFIVNKNFSFGTDSLPYADMMNQLWHIDKKLQYDFYWHGLPKKKRFNKWIKADAIDNVEIVKEYYKCSERLAKQYINILTEDQIKEIKKKLFKGGIK